MIPGRRSPLARSSGSAPRRVGASRRAGASRRTGPSRGAGASRRTGGPGRAGLLWLRLFLIIVVILLLADVLPAPWALQIGGRFSILGEWDGWGPVTASDGGSYVLFTHLHGGLSNGDYSACNFHGCQALTGTAQLCSAGARTETFGLSGAVHGWLSTDQTLTEVDLTGGSPAPLPPDWVIAFHGSWQGPVLPIVDTDNSFTEVVTKAGGIRRAASTAATGTARGVLRRGSMAGFIRACHDLASGRPPR